MDGNTFRVSNLALYAYLATFVWMTLPSGVYLIFKGEVGWGVLLVAIAIAFVIAAVAPRLSQSLAKREIPRSRASFMILGSASSGILVALYAISLTSTSRSSSGYGVIYAIGILILTVILVVGLINSTRERAR